MTKYAAYFDAAARRSKKTFTQIMSDEPLKSQWLAVRNIEMEINKELQEAHDLIHKKYADRMKEAEEALILSLTMIT